MKNILRNTRQVASAALCGLAALSAARAAKAEDTGYLCSDWADAVALDAQQRVLVGGSAADNRVLEWDTGHAHFGDFAVARLLRDGSPDDSFGAAGSVFVDVGDFESVASVAAFPGGVVAAGTTANQLEGQRGPGDITVVRWDESGATDAGFGQQGVALFDFGGSETVSTVIAGGGGRSFVVGAIESGADSDILVLALKASGALDETFGEAGVAHIDLGSPDDQPFGARLSSSGLIIGGQTSVAGQAAAFVLHLDRHGRLRRHFGQGGISRIVVGGAPGSSGAASLSRRGASAVSLSSGAEDGSTRVLTVAFDAAGRPTVSEPFPIDIPQGSVDSVSAGALTRGGALYLAGATYPDDFATGDAWITRTGLDGLVDTTFGGGVVSEHFDLEYAAFNDLAVSRDGVTAAGWNFGEQEATLPPSDALVVRYRHDGQVDASFGTSGVVLLDYRGGAAVCGPRSGT